jgi:prophage antirepressor-like protein
MTLEVNILTAAEQVAVPPIIASFEFQHHPIRATIVEDVEVFIAKDVAQILGFGNPRQAVRSHVSKRDRYGVQLMDAMGRAQTLLAINESGIYALAFGSSKPEARVFRDWVTSEVIPSLRRTGKYEIKDRLPALLEEVAKHLGNRGAAKGRQLNRIVPRRDGLFDFRIGRRWSRGVDLTAATGLPLSHRLREGLALSSLQLGAVKTRQ